jgi:hypothetical protein
MFFITSEANINAPFNIAIKISSLSLYSAFIVAEISKILEAISLS